MKHLNIEYFFFDEEAAYTYSNIMGYRKNIGRPFNLLDGQIAAIALTKKATLVTQNIRDFSDCNLELINPFEI